LRTESGDLNAMVSKLNETMRNMWQIDWCGQFRDLCEGDGEFPLKMRESYWEDERPASTDPILPDRIGDFVEFLKTYGY
jgi:hypothetical protein